MSYILEALKKAQAERQLGATPTIHAPTLDGGVGTSRGSAMKMPLVIAVGVMAAAIVALLVVVFRQQASAPQPVPQAPLARHDAAATPQPPAAAPPSATQPAPLAAAPQASGAAAPQQNAIAPVAPAPRAAMPETQRAIAAQAPGIAPSEAGAALPAPQAARPAVPAAPNAAAATAPRAEPLEAQRSAAAAPAGPAPATASAQQTPAPAQPEVTQTLRDLPEPIQRAIPQITFGGYMYSKNPADRMVLIDKILRKEGEEVAPGLVLEKLLPKAAVFSFRGYRYRVSL